MWQKGRQARIYSKSIHVAMATRMLRSCPLFNYMQFGQSIIKLDQPLRSSLLRAIQIVLRMFSELITAIAALT